MLLLLLLLLLLPLHAAVTLHAPFSSDSDACTQRGCRCQSASQSLHESSLGLGHSLNTPPRLGAGEKTAVPIRRRDWLKPLRRLLAELAEQLRARSEANEARQRVQDELVAKLEEQLRQHEADSIAASLTLH